MSFRFEKSIHGLLFLVSIALAACGGGAEAPSANAPGASVPAADMTATRSGGHTATLLQSGKVLVVGGRYTTSSGGLPVTQSRASGELYDPAGNAWAPVASLAMTRANHTATLLPSGKVLVVGGWYTTFTWLGASVTNYLASAELYDPVSNVWTSVASLSTARTNHTATLLANGTVLVTGGTNGTPLANAELYDPVANTWTSAGNLATPRSGHTSVLLPNGMVLVAGGWNSSYLASSELYDPATNTWGVAANLGIARGNHTATVLANGKVLVAGGRGGSVLLSAELYDPSTDTWAAAGSLVNTRTYFTATLLPNGKVLAIAGLDDTEVQGVYYYLPLVELYDPTTNSWTLTASIAKKRAYHVATLLSNGKVLVLGGEGISGVESSAELYSL